MLFIKKYLLLCILIVLILLPAQAYACWGYRAMGMGGVFVAVADDANLAYWNRAGAGQLDDWNDGQRQLIQTDQVMSNNQWFVRTPRVGNPYYDSINFAQKINHNFGWSIAAAYNGGNSFDFSPSIGFRLPGGGVFDKMSIGLGYFLWNLETYGIIGGNQKRLDVLIQQIHLDYLWKVTQEFNFGVHIERFWQFSERVTSPDVPGYEENFSGNIAESMNFRPGIAWMPKGNLEGLIVNAGIYDLFAQGGGPYYSFGFEYTPFGGIKKAGCGRGQGLRTAPTNICWLKRSHFRAGVYNLGVQNTSFSLYTIGYGYDISPDMELGYWGGFGFDSASGYTAHNIGFSWKF